MYTSELSEALSLQGRTSEGGRSWLDGCCWQELYASPINSVTLSEGSRFKAGIPEQAVFFGFFDPLCWMMLMLQCAIRLHLQSLKLPASWRDRVG